MGYYILQIITCEKTLETKVVKYKQLDYNRFYGIVKVSQCIIFANIFVKN